MADDIPQACAMRGGAGRPWLVIGAGLYVALIALGAATLYLAIGEAPLNWIIAAAFVVYAPVAGYIFAARGCGNSAHRSVGAVPGHAGEKRTAAFLLHLPILLPAWLAPPIVAGVALSAEWSVALAAVAAAFLVEAFIVLPLVARLAVCVRCPQRHGCPFMSLDAWR